MILRSLLFVPGDRPERFAKAEESGADAVIFDLEDAVAPDRKSHARRAIADFFLDAPGRVHRFVRINPLDAPFAPDDVAAVAAMTLDGIVLPKASGATSIFALDALLAEAGAAPTPILPIGAETPDAIFGLSSFRAVAERLVGLTWGAEDLSGTVGSSTAREEDGNHTAPYHVARALVLFAASAAGTAPIETVYAAFRDLEGLACHATRAARDGFTGMLAIHPSQVASINLAFTPSADEIEHARAIVNAFAAAPDSGALQFGGRMIDAPHLKRARYLLERAGQR